MYIIKLRDEDGTISFAHFDGWGWRSYQGATAVFSSEESAQKVIDSYFGEFIATIKNVGD